jgi:Zn-dependent oligopeptidase
VAGEDARGIDPSGKEQPDATTTSVWNGAYLTRLIKKEQYNLDPQEVRRYFAYDTPYCAWSSVAMISRTAA